jgi:2-phosphosulfolactate phosphatase
VLVVAAGERWPDGSLRPAVEDALGAGAVLSQLRRAGCRLSTEAMGTALLFEATDVAAALRSCGSARELQAIGFAADVEIAAALDVDDHAAVLRDGAFVADRTTS